jgi:unsaturated pyranuronate lyase
MNGPFVDLDRCPVHELAPGFTVRTAWGEHMMMSLVTLQASAVIDSHSHPHEQMGVVIEGECEFTIGQETRTVGPGQMYVIPGDVVHKVTAGDHPVKALDFFYPVRPEYQ